MDDIIYRQAAIDAIRASTAKYTGLMEMEMYTDDDAIEAIEKLPSAQEWISVEERLPERGQVVLAFGTKSSTTGQFQGIGSKPWFWWWKGNTIKRVTHWMPLPKPPKE